VQPRRVGSFSGGGESWFAEGRHIFCMVPPYTRYKSRGASTIAGGARPPWPPRRYGAAAVTIIMFLLAQSVTVGDTDHCSFVSSLWQWLLPILAQPVTVTIAHTGPACDYCPYWPACDSNYCPYWSSLWQWLLPILAQPVTVTIAHTGPARSSSQHLCYEYDRTACDRMGNRHIVISDIFLLKIQETRWDSCQLKCPHYIDREPHAHVQTYCSVMDILQTH